MLTDGSSRLSEALKPKVMTQSELAKRLNVSPQAVSDWVAGKSKPRADLMAQIEDLLGIPMRAWTEPSSEEGAA
jgi:transcriptional regulator with XRE-family HTH domain